ncbi:hypothetical protein [Sorangium sp. So ce887]|uniref:hypothetical protein n=1 Tax=Sorangium sp. So ce887 TaxID=3133324 RepID=UPI003F5E2745
MLLPGEGRSDDFLSRVERVCRLREPDRREDPGLVSTLVYGGEPAPEELVRYASAPRVRLVRFLEYQGLIDFRGYLCRRS